MDNVVFAYVSLFVCGLLGLTLLGLHHGTLDEAGSASSDSCSCGDAMLCKPVEIDGRKEIFIFSLNPKNKEWRFYDWDKVTTVVMVGYLDKDLVCLAHKYRARAITIGNVGTEVLPNASARKLWIQQQLALVKKYHLDGINFDYENALLPNETTIRDGYTQLVAETSQEFKAYNPHLMISVDVAWSPDNIDLRYYDYRGLAAASDLLFIMAYDEQSQILGDCIAKSNSDYQKTLSGLQGWLETGISTDRLILGVPWYGYYYPCIAMSKDNVCSIRKVPFRGVQCSDAAGKEINYSVIIQMLKNSTSGKLYDNNGRSPYFNYEDPESGVMHQVRYDDPDSLLLKYQLALDNNLRGVGMWNSECVNYTSQQPDDIMAVKDMWDALPDYHKVKQ